MAKLMPMHILQELSITEERELPYAVFVVFGAKNQQLRKAGSFPMQIALNDGRSLGLDGAANQLATGFVPLMLNHSATESGQLRRKARIRNTALAPFAWLDSYERLRAALSSRSHPPKDILSSGMVCDYKFQGQVPGAMTSKLNVPRHPAASPVS